MGYYNVNIEIEEEVVVESGSFVPDAMTVELLGSLLADLPEPVKAVPVKVKTKAAVRVMDMTDVERRVYNAEKAQERRNRIAVAKTEENIILFDATTTRDALADAALIIIRNNLPGAAEVKRYLAGVFRTQVGACMTIEAQIKGGKLRPKLVSHAQPKKM